MVIPKCTECTQRGLWATTYRVDQSYAWQCSWPLDVLALWYVTLLVIAAKLHFHRLTVLRLSYRLSMQSTKPFCCIPFLLVFGAWWRSVGDG